MTEQSISRIICGCLSQPAVAWVSQGLAGARRLADKTARLVRYDDHIWHAMIGLISGRLLGHNAPDAEVVRPIVSNQEFDSMGKNAAVLDRPKEARQAYKWAAEEAERMSHKDHHKVSDWTPGDTWAQGDVNFTCLKDLPNNVTEKVPDSVQLAPGNTPGSRHCLESLAGVKMFVRGDATELDGPILVTDRAITVTHPEHGHVTLPCGNPIAVTYQRSAAEEVRRRMD